MSRRKSILVNFILLPVLAVLINFVAGEIAFDCIRGGTLAFHSDPRLGKTNLPPHGHLC